MRNERRAAGVAWGDFDDDGWPDLYVSNHNGANRLYRNRRDGTFVDLAPEAGVTAPWSSGAVVVWDFDHDGLLDLFVGAASPEHRGEPVERRTDALGPLAAAVASLLGLPHAGETGRLYRGLGGGRFEDATRARGLARVVPGGGIGLGDLDGDGFLDLYLGTAFPGFEGLLPNVLYRNRGGRDFADVTTAAGLGHLQKTGGIAVADLDGDGDQDVFLRTGGMFAGDAFGGVLFDNPGSGAHWLAVRLVGTRSNRAAIGARLRLEVEEDGRRRTIHRRVGEGSSWGAHPPALWVGLGRAGRVVRAEVEWPTSGLRQTFRDLPVDRQVRIVEGEGAVDAGL